MPPPYRPLDGGLRRFDGRLLGRVEFGRHVELRFRRFLGGRRRSFSNGGLRHGLAVGFAAERGWVQRRGLRRLLLGLDDGKGVFALLAGHALAKREIRGANFPLAAIGTASRDRHATTSRTGRKAMSHVGYRAASRASRGQFALRFRAAMTIVGRL